MEKSLSPRQNVALDAVGRVLASLPNTPLTAVLVMAVIETESAFNAAAVSSDGAGSVGLMQVLPQTAHMVGVTGQQSDPRNSVLAGCRFLIWGWGHLRARFGRDPTETEWINGYNRGYSASLAALQEGTYASIVLRRRQLWLDRLSTAPASDNSEVHAMSIWATIIPMMLAVLDHLPALVADIEDIFNKLHAISPAPDVHAAAMQAAIASARQTQQPQQ